LKKTANFGCMPEKRKYFVLLTDVVRSREIPDRKKFDQKITMALKEVVARFGEMFVLPIKQWKGVDETAAVIKDPGDIYQMVKCIREIIFPQKMRFVLVKGEVNMKKEVTDITLLDGEAFHIASLMMSRLKTEETIFKCNSQNEPEDLALDNQVNLVDLVQDKWTEKQMSIYSLYYKTNNQQEVAKKYKITQQSVSKALNAINAPVIMEVEKNIIKWAKENYR
jgi:hypothetical protein